MIVLELMWRHRTLVAVLVRRELDARYRASFLGFFWSLLNPLLLLAVYAVVFTYIFSPRFPGGEPYSLFLFSALLPWLFFSGAVLDGSTTLIDNGPLLAKVMCPPEIFPAVTVVSHLVHHLLALPILLAAMVLAAVTGLHPFPWTFWLVGLALIPWIMVTLGAVLAISVLSVYYRDMRDLVGHILNLLFFSSPIIYSLDGLEVPPLLRQVLAVNPLASLVTVYRDVVFTGTVPGVGAWLTAFAVGLVSLWLGTRVFLHFRETLVEAGVKGSLRFADVGKLYRWRGQRRRGETLKGALFQRYRKNLVASTEEHVALDGLDLVVDPGEAIAVIGPNGSGKSTFLKLASGILRPTSGDVTVDGRVTALIELGAGFHPEISGRENVLINGMLLGLTRTEVEERMPAIVEFADIGDFIDQPVKTYSSGMYVRLGFAVAVSADPDILLIDEVLAVGDQAFTRRCLDRLARMRQRGVTMILVSHDLDLVTSFADRAVYLDNGRQVTVGPADTVVARYRSDAAGEDNFSEAEAPAVRVVEEGRRWGNGDVEIVGVDALAGGSPQRLLPNGGPCRLRITYKVHRPVEDFVFGVAWHRADGTQVSGHNTELGGLISKSLADDGEISCVYEALELAPGEYFLDVAVHASEGLAYDYWCDALRVRVTSPVDWPGIWAPSHRWESSGPQWRLK